MSEKIIETKDKSQNAQPQIEEQIPTKTPESPTTAKELDFDDDVPESSTTSKPVLKDSKGSIELEELKEQKAQSESREAKLPKESKEPKDVKKVSFKETTDDDEVIPSPPPKPPRPISPKAHAENTLIEAFPSIDSKVIKAVLVASGGNVEPAFNALLSMSDPNFENDMIAPPPPKKMSQVESDALYARQLAQHYNQSSSHTGFGGRGQGDPPVRRQSNTSLNPNELDRDRSFFDDDLPVIKQNLAKGFQDTKTTLNKWIKDFQKKLDGDESDEEHEPPQRQPQQFQRQNFGPSQSDQLYGIQRSAENKREKERYDADPQLLEDDFSRRLELRDDEAAPSKPPRPLANPDLFKSAATPTSDTISQASKSSLATTTGTSATAATTGSTTTGNSTSTTPKSGKWQPLTSVEPTPVDHDPFSLGDSDEENEVIQSVASGEVKEKPTNVPVTKDDEKK